MMDICRSCCRQRGENVLDESKEVSIARVFEQWELREYKQ